jgi:FkbM family methyltransferase
MIKNTPKTPIPRGTAKAIGRSLRIYYGNNSRDAAMDKLYRHYVKPDGLAFDIGAHVGDRIASFRRLGARVVALEPQPGPLRALQLIHGRDSGVALIASACGQEAGSVSFHINSANPTVSTASPDFLKAADGAGGWEGQIWDQTITVPCTTLDELIRLHGVPDFIKIDVEGFEDAVLAGLSMPVAALSFEFTTIQRDVAAHCLNRIAKLGDYRFNIALGESQIFDYPKAVALPAMLDHIVSLPHDANSGDIYATLELT